MATNKVLEAGTPLQVLMPANVTLTSGQLVLLGTIAGVCNFTNPDPTYPNPSAQMSLDTSGGFNLTCSAVTSISPSVGSAIARGDTLYADGGTKDATSGLTYGFTIDKNSGGVKIGTALSTLTSGTTGTVLVRIN